MIAIASSVAIIISITIFDIADDVFALTRHEIKKQTLTVSDISELPNALANVGIIKHPQLFSLYVSISEKELKRNSAKIFFCSSTRTQSAC